MEFTSGEGAVSTGSLVPVHAAQDRADARAVVELLEAHEIPALLDGDVVGAAPFGWHVEGRTQVLVPSSMLIEARQLLHRFDYQTEGPSGAPEPPPRVVRLRALPSRVAASAAEDVRAEGARVEETHAEEARAEGAFEEIEEPSELPLPEPSPLRPRFALALLAIASGTAFQWALVRALGRGVVFGELAARAPVGEAPWRLITAGFLHASFTHFASNALMGLLIGIVLFGTHRVGATMLAWVAASAVGIAFETALSPEALIVGASAGNYGLVGLWAKGQLERAELSTLPRRERLRTVGLLLLLVPGALTPFSSTGTKIAIAAHAAGFLAGFSLGYLLHRRFDPARFVSIDRRALWAGVVAVSIVLTALAAAAFDLAAGA